MPISKSTARGLGFLAVTAAMAAIFLATRRTERLRTLEATPELRLIGVRNGELILTRGSREITFLAQPVKGGVQRAICPAVTVEGQISAVLMEEDRILIRTFTQETASPSNDSRDPPKSPVMHTYAAGFEGAAPREIREEVSPSRGLRNGTNRFWVRGGKPSPPARVFRNGKWVSAKPASQAPPADAELMATPSSGGSSRVVAKVQPATPILKVGDGIGWRELEATGAVADELYYALPPDYKIGVLPGCRFASSLQNPQVYVLADRAVWIEAAEDYHAVVSSSLDGADRRILNSDKGQRGHVTFLEAHHGGLFALLTKPSPNGGALGKQALYRIDPRGKGELRLLDPVPPTVYGGMLDGSYFYYTLLERPDNWFDWSSEGLGRQQTGLYRIRL